MPAQLMPRRLPSLWVLHTLLSHWWRHPVQLSTLIVGLLAATALWSGVQALNQQARFSYEQAAARFNSLNQAHIVSATEQPLLMADYIQLRRLGWRVTPLLEGSLTLADDQPSLSIIGIEPMTLQGGSTAAQRASGLPNNLSLTPFLSPPWQLWVSPLTAKRLTPLLISASSTNSSANSTDFPLNPLAEQVTLKVSAAVADNELITDIYVAQHWLNQPGQFSRLLLLDDTSATVAAFNALPVELATRLRLIMPQSDHDISRLTASFHLNLTALSLLAFLVGLLMVYSAIHLALTQRLVLRRILSSCGVSQRELVFWLLVELLLLSGLIALPGLLLGYWIAALLLPDVAASLSGLYGAQLLADLQLSWQWWQQGVLMAWGGTLIAAIVPLLKLVKHQAGHPSHTIKMPAGQLQRRLLVATGVIAGSLALLVAWLGSSLLSGFILLGLVFLTAALLMPVLLDVVLQLCQRIALAVSAAANAAPITKASVTTTTQPGAMPQPRAAWQKLTTTSSAAVTQWLWADARMQVPHLSVALVALLLALSTSIGVGGMVEGFRNTFTGWLEQRLAAEVYLRTDSDAQALQVTQWLSQHPKVSAILPSAGTDTQLAGMPIELRGITLHSTYVDHWPLLSKTADAWQRIETQGAVMINEQLARQLALTIGDNLPLDLPVADLPASSVPPAALPIMPIVAIFSDYGNPKGQVMMSLSTLYQHWPAAERGSVALRVSPTQIDALMQALRNEFAFTDSQLIDQQAVKHYSLQLFERTFAATQALNVLVLAIAAIALFSSLLTLSSMRLSQIAPLWACGISRRQLVLIELLRLLLLALLTALLAIPLGLIISYCLVTVINVRAFGWALPWQLFPLQWLYLTLAALGSAFLAALIPVLKLQFSSPSALLKGFRDDQ